MDLQPKTALPISLNDDGNLLFRQPLSPVIPAHRTIDDMRAYLADPNTDFIDQNRETEDYTGRQDQKPTVSVYDMYRDIHLPQDDFAKQNLRFDITVFHPGILGKEYCKTIGHYHPFVPGTKVRYPETYEVVLGKGLFIMQKMDDSFTEVLDIYAIKISEGEDVIFLPGYAHFLINPTDDILITSDWSEATFKSEYDPVKQYHGAAYYAIKGADGQPEFIVNPSYKNVPKLRFLKPKELPQFGLVNNQPAYRTGQISPDMLQFLIKPELYLQELTVENCYTPVQN